MGETPAPLRPRMPPQWRAARFGDSADVTCAYEKHEEGSGEVGW